MRAVLQRVRSAEVKVDGRVTGSVGQGLLVFLGVMETDTRTEAELMARKVAEIRIFEDENEKMNLSVRDVDGGVLAVSQFTLCADISHGRRPSFTPSAAPEAANELYEYFCDCLQVNGVGIIEKGVFGADMAVSLLNDGPVTIVMDTDIWQKKR